MKKFFFGTGIIILLVVGYGFVNDRINKDYYDYRTIKVKDKGEYLIIRKNSKLTVLTLSNQSVDQKTANFKWCTGNESTFDLTDSTTFEHGAGLTGDGIEKGKLSPIEFDEYQFYWSPSTN